MRRSGKYNFVFAVSISVLVLLLSVGHASPAASFAPFPAFRNQTASYPRGSGHWLVIPAKRVGAVTLGDAASSVLKLFPKPSIGSSTAPGHPGFICGTAHTIGLLQDARHPGFLNVFVKDGKVVEVEAAGARYHTADGIASNSPPENVRLRYKGLKSYLFLGGYYEALNEGPLVLWTDQEKGIAFTFAYPARGDTRLLVFTMIVFTPGASFCVQDSVFPDHDRWRELRPYSLQSPAQSSSD